MMKRIFILSIVFTMFITANSYSFVMNTQTYEGMDSMAKGYDSNNERVDNIRKYIYSDKNISMQKKRAEEVMQTSKDIFNFDYKKGKGEIRFADTIGIGTKWVTSFNNWKVYKTEVCRNNHCSFYTLRDKGVYEKGFNKSGEYIEIYYDLIDRKANILDAKINDINFKDKNKALKVLDALLHFMDDSRGISQLRIIKELLDREDGDKNMQTFMDVFISTANDLIEKN